jgi:hypothetical protein
MEPNYIRIDGTSMATPHTAGAAALIKQAHQDWTPDVVRTVLINTATNMRNNTGGAKADGLTADPILAQGGGLIDVYHAINAKALMGVTGDGIDTPAILGSYSYGEVPVANSRIQYTAPVTVTIRDMSGQGGTYNLNIANNRDLQLSGVGATLSQTSVNVPANGSATFTVTASFDGDLLRDSNTVEVNGTTVTFRPIQMQWYVTAQRADGGESLRMPFYFRPGQSLPAQPVIDTQTQTATVPAGTAGQNLVSGVDHVDVPFEVSASTYKVEALAQWFSLPTGQFQDLDYQLLDPDGNVIASSGNGAGASEFVSVRVNRPGTYKHRLVGFTNVATDVTITTTLAKGPDAPTPQTIAGDFVDAQGQQVDFDGSFTLRWTPRGGEQGYELEQLAPGSSDWQIIGDVNASTTSYAFNSLTNGLYSFRVRGLQPGQIGKYVTAPSGAVSVLVDRRSKVDITNAVNQAISNVSFTGGVFQLDLSLTNNSTQYYVPLVDLNIVGINSGTGTVKAINADNGKDGKSTANAALFSYSAKLGGDQVFAPSEVSGVRTLRFQDSASELFTWDSVVTAYLRTGAGAPVQDSGPPPQNAIDGGSSSSGGTVPLTQLKAVLRFTANPLTKSVSAQLIRLQ